MYDYNRWYSLGNRTLLIIPGRTMIKNGSIFIYPAKMVAPCACDKLLAARALCTIT